MQFSTWIFVLPIPLPVDNGHNHMNNNIFREPMVEPESLFLQNLAANIEERVAASIKRVPGFKRLKDELDAPYLDRLVFNNLLKCGSRDDDASETLVKLFPVTTIASCPPPYGLFEVIMEHPRPTGLPDYVTLSLAADTPLAIMCEVEKLVEIVRAQRSGAQAVAWHRTIAIYPHETTETHLFRLAAQILQLVGVTSIGSITAKEYHDQTSLTWVSGRVNVDELVPAGRMLSYIAHGNSATIMWNIRSIQMAMLADLKVRSMESQEMFRSRRVVLQGGRSESDMEMLERLRRMGLVTVDKVFRGVNLPAVDALIKCQTRVTYGVYIVDVGVPPYPVALVAAVDDPTHLYMNTLATLTGVAEDAALVTQKRSTKMYNEWTKLLGHKYHYPMDATVIRNLENGNIKCLGVVGEPIQPNSAQAKAIQGAKGKITMMRMTLNDVVVPKQNRLHVKKLLAAGMEIHAEPAATMELRLQQLVQVIIGDLSMYINALMPRRGEGDSDHYARVTQLFSIVVSDPEVGAMIRRTASAEVQAPPTIAAEKLFKLLDEEKNVHSIAKEVAARRVAARAEQKKQKLEDTEMERSKSLIIAALAHDTVEYLAEQIEEQVEAQLSRRAQEQAHADAEKTTAIELWWCEQELRMEVEQQHRRDRWLIQRQLVKMARFERLLVRAALRSLFPSIHKDKSRSRPLIVVVDAPAPVAKKAGNTELQTLRDELRAWKAKYASLETAWQDAQERAQEQVWQFQQLCDCAGMLQHDNAMLAQMNAGLVRRLETIAYTAHPSTIF